MAFLKKVQLLELKIDEYLNLVSESGVLLDQLVKFFLKKQMDSAREKCQRIRSHERTADEYRKQIETHLYRHTLIPENRGDVLAILETTDHVINQVKSVSVELINENHLIPEIFENEFCELIHSSANSIDELVKAVRAFFYNIHSVHDHTHKVFFYEKEVDDLAEKIKIHIFESSLDLALKIHLKQLILSCEEISDLAQSVCDRLVIYTIKRQL